MMNFEQFVESGMRNAWIEEPGISLYVRKSFLPKLRGDYELANMTATKKGTGSLANFLNRWESKYQFFIENVLDPKFNQYWLDRGYTMLSKGPPACFLGPDKNTL